MSKFGVITTDRFFAIFQHLKPLNKFSEFMHSVRLSHRKTGFGRKSCRIASDVVGG